MTSLAYGFERKNNETILVFDLHGGIFDVGDGVFEVLSTSGDTHLGGDDFDMRIVDSLAMNFKNDEGIDLLKDKQMLQHLTETTEKAKMELTSFTQTNINLPFILKLLLHSSFFEELCFDSLDRLKTQVEIVYNGMQCDLSCKMGKENRLLHHAIYPKELEKDGKKVVKISKANGALQGERLAWHG
eukprot:Gb_37938 [translate_table: standard]